MPLRAPQASGGGHFWQTTLPAESNAAPHHHHPPSVAVRSVSSFALFRLVCFFFRVSFPGCLLCHSINLSFSINLSTHPPHLHIYHCEYIPLVRHPGGGGGGLDSLDLSTMVLRPDHERRPFWVCADGTVFLETFSPIYKAASDFLIAIAEPIQRCAYVFTIYVLY